MTRTLAALALLASVLLGAPAYADSTTPTVSAPVVRVGDTIDVELMIEAPLKAWGIRRAAKFYDAQVDGLTIHTRGSCAARPLAACVRVFVDAYTPKEMLAISQGTQASWAGLSVIPGNGDPRAPREIHLNKLSVTGPNEMVATHELGHVLGLAHHEGTGLMVAEPLNATPSTAELDALRAWYSSPPA